MNGSEKVITEEEFNKFKEGDQKAFQKVFQCYQQIIYRYVVSYCKVEEEADELVQEVFTQLFVHRLKIRNSAGIYPYIFVLAKRMTISNFKRKIVQSKYLQHLGHHWTEESSDTEKHLDVAELSSILHSIISKLPSRQQEVYCMNLFENLSYQEIADKIGLSKSTVKNQIIVATKKVRWSLAKIYTTAVSIIFFLD